MQAFLSFYYDKNTSSILKKSNHYAILLKKHFTYKTSGTFNWPCHEWSLIWRWCLFYLNSFHCAFAHKEVRCTKKTEIKDGLQYTNKKLSLLGYNNMLYTWGFNNELEKVHFLNHSVFLKLCLLEDCLSLLYERSM